MTTRFDKINLSPRLDRMIQQHVIPFWRLDDSDRDAMVEYLTEGNDPEDLATTLLERYSAEEITGLQAEIDLESSRNNKRELQKDILFLPDDLRKVLITLVQRERLRLVDNREANYVEEYNGDDLAAIVSHLE